MVNTSRAVYQLVLVAGAVEEKALGKLEMHGSLAQSERSDRVEPERESDAG
jgi:hypothetical protein